MKNYWEFDEKEATVPAINCKYCGKVITEHWDTFVTKTLVGEAMCKDCMFYDSLIGSKHVAIQNRHIHVIHVQGIDKMFRANEGKNFVVKFRDGRVIRTHNLKGYGEIPGYFDKLLPDNAEIVGVGP